MKQAASTTLPVTVAGFESAVWPDAAAATTGIATINATTRIDRTFAMTFSLSANPFRAGGH
jgi:hypothetical protein